MDLKEQILDFGRRARAAARVLARLDSAMKNAEKSAGTRFLTKTEL